MSEIKIFTLSETAKILMMTRQTVSKYIRSGDLKARKIGKSYRITQDAIDNFLKAE